MPDPSQNLPVDVCDDNFEYISIIDRNGVEVYKSYDRNFVWDCSGLSSGIYFYLICVKLTKNKNFSLISSSLYLLYPYLFGHAQFNMKDIPFL